MNKNLTNEMWIHFGHSHNFRENILFFAWWAHWFRGTSFYNSLKFDRESLIHLTF